MPLPYLYERELVARAWHCRPCDVDTAPWADIQITLDILGIEAANPLPEPRKR